MPKAPKKKSSAKTKIPRPDAENQAALDKWHEILKQYPSKIVGKKNRKTARADLIRSELHKFKNQVPVHLRADEDVSEGSFIWNKVVLERDDYVDYAEWWDMKIQFHYRRVLQPDSRRTFVKPSAKLSNFMPTQTEIRKEREARKLWFRRLKDVGRLWEKIYDQTQGVTEEERIVAARREVIEQLLSTEKGIQIWQSPDFDQSGQAWSHIVTHPESLDLMRWEKIAPKLVEIYKAFVAKKEAGDEHPNASPEEEPFDFDFTPVPWPFD